MALRYPYADGYLAARVTQAREDQAAAEVAMLGTLPDEWVQRLTVLRAYIITCTECMATADDTYAAKLAAYRREYDTQVPHARAAQAAATASDGNVSLGGGSVFTVELQRS